MTKSEEKLKTLDLKLLILDVDGVLTNGTVYYFDNGIEGKGFNIQDGLGMKQLMRRGVEIAIISGKSSLATQNRLEALGVRHIYLGVGEDKSKNFLELKQKLNLVDKNIVYVGDDLPDLPIMQQVGFSIAVANAVPKVKMIADHVTEHCGGEGAVREVCDMLLHHIKDYP
jgi:3-deoxy-D-manno-octulosonate 8-phosphate phosphatase (KDO 8-P phosphatase)